MTSIRKQIKDEETARANLSRLKRRRRTSLRKPRGSTAMAQGEQRRAGVRGTETIISGVKRRGQGTKAAKGGTFHSASDARRAKKQGYDTEIIALAYAQHVLERLGWSMYRPRAGGRRDKGDIAGMTGWTVEIKNSAHRISEYIEETQREAVNNRTPTRFILVMKRPNQNVKDWFAVTKYGVMLDLVLENELLRREVARLSPQGRIQVESDQSSTG